VRLPGAERVALPATPDASVASAPGQIAYFLGNCLASVQSMCE